MILPTFKIEKELWAKGFKRVMGIDEVGIGSFAGPVVCAGVIFRKEVTIKNVRDSKLLSANQREEVFEKIRAQKIEYSLGRADVEEIDTYGIRGALLLAIGRLIRSFISPPDYLVIDGKFLKDFGFETLYISKGDQKVMSVAAASVIAKVSRDAKLRQIHELYPNYNFKANKGYGSLEHRQALAKHGVTPFHRKSYAPVAYFLKKESEL